MDAVWGTVDRANVTISTNLNCHPSPQRWSSPTTRRSATLTSMTQCSATVYWPPMSPSRSAVARWGLAGETTVKSTPAQSTAQVRAIHAPLPRAPVCSWGNRRASPLGRWERRRKRTSGGLTPSPAFLLRGYSQPAAEFHSLCPDGKGYTQDNNIVNYGIPAHRGKL